MFFNPKKNFFRPDPTNFLIDPKNDIFEKVSTSSLTNDEYEDFNSKNFDPNTFESKNFDL